MDIYESKRKSDEETLLLLTRPGSASGSLREVMTKHIRTLIDAHNADMTARIEFVTTGESSPLIREKVKPFIAPLVFASASEKKKKIKEWEIQKISCPSLTSLDDDEFIVAYNNMLLELRLRLLPDAWLD